MEGDTESYLNVLEDNHWVLVKTADPEVFLDYMHQHRVLSEDDCQEVQNYFINQTRRARMRRFLSIIRTKGPENIKLFFQQLGWEYPHVYREIFRQEPSDPPEAYKQGTKSRLSCDLNQLLTFGLDLKRLQNQKQDLTEQIREMEAMLKHQKNEIEDLERENRRLRQYERENQQNKEKLHTLTEKNDEIKEENRQFLHKIRRLTLELQKRRDQEAALQAKLDEMTQQIQEKSFQLDKKNRDESDLRAKYEFMRKESIKLNQARSRRQDVAPVVTPPQPTTRQNDVLEQLEILTDDMKHLEEINSEMCEQLRYMQTLLDSEKGERDQMHRCVRALELDKNALETRQTTAAQKIERYFNKIRQLEEEKRKLEEERMHMQTKIWEMSQANEKQFEQQHELENRYDQLQQSYEQFRQDHRYCVPGEPIDRPPRQRLPRVIDRQGNCGRPSRSPGSSPCLGKDDPFELFGSFYAPAIRHDEGSSQTDAADKGTRPDLAINPAFQIQNAEKRGSLTVNLPDSMKRKTKQEEDSAESVNDEASTVSEMSSVSSSTFELIDFSDICSYEQNAPNAAGSQQTSGDVAATGNFFIRSNVKEEGEGDKISVQEGDILFVVHTEEERWTVVGVEKTSGRRQPHCAGYIPNPESAYANGKGVRRNPSDAANKPATLERKYAIRRDGMKRQHSIISFTMVYPMKATRLLPVLLLCPTSVMNSLLSCMETTAQDWACVIHDGHTESSSQLFAESSRHNVLPWEVRPKDLQKYTNNLHMFIILIITLQSQDALLTFRHLLGEPALDMDYEQEMKYLTERQDLVTLAGLHSETVTVAAGQDDREAFWQEVKDKVSLVQQQVFWLESVPLTQ